MYESCISCTKASISCHGPHLPDLTIEEAIVLMKARKKFLNLTNQVVAERSKTPKGTIDGIFAGTHTDLRFETLRPAWNVLFGGYAADNACHDLLDSERAKYEERIRQLEKDVVWHEDKIKHLTQQNEDLLKQKEAMQTLITNTNARATQDKDFLRKQLDERYHFLKRKDKTIIILSVLLGISLLTIITALIIDRMNGGVGFFWLESLLRPHGINEILQKWST